MRLFLLIGLIVASPLWAETTTGEQRSTDTSGRPDLTTGNGAGRFMTGFMTQFRSALSTGDVQGLQQLMTDLNALRDRLAGEGFGADQDNVRRQLLALEQQLRELPADGSPNITILNQIPDAGQQVQLAQQAPPQQQQEQQEQEKQQEQGAAQQQGQGEMGGKESKSSDLLKMFEKKEDSNKDNEELTDVGEGLKPTDVVQQTTQDNGNKEFVAALSKGHGSNDAANARLSQTTQQTVALVFQALGNVNGQVGGAFTARGIRSTRTEVVRNAQTRVGELAQPRIVSGPFERTADAFFKRKTAKGLFAAIQERRKSMRSLKGKKIPFRDKLRGSTRDQHIRSTDTLQRAAVASPQPRLRKRPRRAIRRGARSNSFPRSTHRKR